MDDNNFSKGIDVSHHQGVIDWPAVVADGVKFVMIKASEGSHFVDPLFHTNWQATATLPMQRSAYHFFLPLQDATLQAQHFLQLYDSAQTTLPPALDVEQNGSVSPSQYADSVTQWLTTVTQSLGIKPFIYTSQRFWDSVIARNLSEYPLWLAHWSQHTPLVSELPLGWQDWHIWQATQKGKVRGIHGPVDIDFMR